MKKNLFYVALFAVAVSSCAKNEVADISAPTAIGFGTFIDKTTKAEVTTIENLGGAYIYAYQTGEYAWENRSSATVEYTTSFMDNVLLDIAADGTTTYNDTDDEAYWPTDGSYVSFFSYGPSAASDLITYTDPTASAEYTLTYASSSTVADQYDIVVAEATDKSIADNVSGADVQLSYNHIQSWFSST